MSDETHDETRPIGAAGPESPMPETPHAAESGSVAAEPVTVAGAHTVPEGYELRPVRQRFADRLWGLRSLIAVGLAALILGGLGGFALSHASEGGGERAGPGRFGGPQGQQGQAPRTPTTPG